MAAEVTPGKDTTEFKVTQSVGVWSIVGLILGLILEIGGGVMESLELSGTALIVSGAVLQALSILRDTLVRLGYLKSRTDVKDAAVKAEEVV